MNTRGWRLTARLLLALALLAGAAACGGDDEEEATGSPSGPTETTADGGDEGGAEGEGAGGDIDAYCEATLAIETIPEPEIDFEELSPEEQAEAAKTFATDELQPLAQEIEAAAPEEISEDIAVLADTVDTVAETGDFGALETPETEEASNRVHEFDLENCGWNEVDVTAVDYAFEGIPETVEAGPASFEFENSSENGEFHELVLFKKNEGTTESIEELLQLGEEEAMTKVTPMGGIFAEPGDSDWLVAELEAGDYAAVCFIPVGATPENEEGNGPPHFVQGMLAEFTVE